MSTNWRMKRAIDPSFTDVHMVAFDSEEQMEVKEFQLQGRTGTGVSVGQLGGIRASCRVLVRSAAEDDAIMAILLSRQAIDLESSLNEQWEVRVVSKIDRRQILAPSNGAQPVKHQFFLEFNVVETAS